MQGGKLDEHGSRRMSPKHMSSRPLNLRVELEGISLRHMGARRFYYEASVLTKF